MCWPCLFELGALELKGLCFCAAGALPCTAYPQREHKQTQRAEELETKPAVDILVLEYIAADTERGGRSIYCSEQLIGDWSSSSRETKCQAYVQGQGSLVAAAAAVVVQPLLLSQLQHIYQVATNCTTVAIYIDYSGDNDATCSLDRWVIIHLPQRKSALTNNKCSSSG